MEAQAPNTLSATTPPRGDRPRRSRRFLALLVVPLLLLCVCCDAPAWPTFAWQAVAPSCGQITITDGTATTSSNATLAEACFARAYRRCSAASLGVTEVALDGGSTNEFVIEPFGFACAIGDLWRGRGLVVVPPFLGAGFGYCGGLHAEQTGLRVTGCPNGGDVVVPGGS